MSKIAILSPFSKFTEMLRNVSLENEDDIEVVEAYGSKALHIAQQLKNSGCEAIICRWHTSAYLATSELSIPILNLKISEFDLLKQTYKISTKGRKKLGYIFYSEELMDYDFDVFEGILGIKILPLPYRLPADNIEEQIERAMKNEVDIVLTTGICIAKRCANYGVRAEVVYPNRNSVVKSIERAKEIISANAQYLEYNRQLQTIINSTRDGMLVVDNKEIVTMMNPVAKKILCADANVVVGKPISSLDSQLDKPFLSIKHEDDKIVKYRNKQLLIKRVSLDIGNKSAWGSLFILQDVSEVQKLDQQIRAENLTKGLSAKFTLSDIKGKSQAIQKIKKQLERYAESDSTILITGESGSGKELVAQSIHNSSRRKHGPFVAINCASLPGTLLESELFGYEKGSFTGADKRGKGGLFELAHKGTLFLDEIGDFPLSLQPKLLRVLQEKEVRRIGSDRIIPVDVRVLAATNKDLLMEVQKENFREDIYYRLNVLSINIPPLRERREDIEELANLFINKYQNKNWARVPFFSFSQVSKLTHYHWPGNIRELENFIERYVLLYNASNDNGDDIIDQFFVQRISGEIIRTKNEPEVLAIRIGALRDMELQILIKLVEGYQMDKNKVANLLGISRTTLWKKLKEVSG